MKFQKRCKKRSIKKKAIELFKISIGLFSSFKNFYWSFFSRFEILIDLFLRNENLKNVKKDQLKFLKDEKK